MTFLCYHFIYCKGLAMNLQSVGENKPIPLAVFRNIMYDFVPIEYIIPSCSVHSGYKCIIRPPRSRESLCIMWRLHLPQRQSDSLANKIPIIRSFSQVWFEDLCKTKILTEQNLTSITTHIDCNVIDAGMRFLRLYFRHQYPYYCGIFDRVAPGCSW